MGFDGKVVIVTGASSGIGAAVAIKFAEQKAKVVIAARSADKLKDVAAACKKHGTEPLVIITDVCKDSDINNIVTTTISKYGKIDILINNAGIGKVATILDKNAMQVFDQVMTTNLRSVVYLTHLAAPHLVQTKGNIINISSIAALDIISGGQFAYCASKAAMDHFTRSVAADLGPKGVRVNTVNPGPVITDFVSEFIKDKEKQAEHWTKMGSATVLGRVSVPDEIADLVLFLTSDRAKAITGSSVVTDNGFLVKKDLKI